MYGLYIHIQESATCSFIAMEFAWAKWGDLFTKIMLQSYLSMNCTLHFRQNSFFSWTICIWNFLPGLRSLSSFHIFLDLTQCTAWVGVITWQLVTFKNKIKPLTYGLPKVKYKNYMRTFTNGLQWQMVNYVQIQKVSILFQNSWHCYYLLDNVRNHHLSLNIWSFLFKLLY